MGFVPQLPRIYSQELGNLIRSMLDLSPKRRPSTKTLLADLNIRKACHLNQLLSAAEKIAEQTKDLQEQREQLEKAQMTLADREQALKIIFGTPSEWESRVSRVMAREQ